MSESVAPADFSPTVAAADPDASSGFLTGLLLGGLVGVTVAMIVAPQAGDPTRDILRSKAREASESVRDAADDVTASANDLLARGKQIVDDARARFYAAVADGKDAAAQQRSILKHET